MPRWHGASKVQHGKYGDTEAEGCRERGYSLKPWRALVCFSLLLFYISENDKKCS